MLQYFIVKHDLESFTAMPGLVWRTNLPKCKKPIGFRKVQEGDRWIEFAYIKDELDREPCSFITGFYECIKPYWYGDIPVDEGTLDKTYWEGRKAHMIKGEPCKGYQPRPHNPVSVPSIHAMLGKNIQPRVAIASITREDFHRIRNETRKRELDPRLIPLLEREPTNEQEVLSLVISGYKALGIDKIIQVQTRFPDMLVEIGGKEVYLELEVDSVGFWDHIEKKQLRRVRRGKYKRKFAPRVADQEDNRPVAVLCWVDGDMRHELQKQVPKLRVIELQSLIRDGKKISWR